MEKFNYVNQDQHIFLLEMLASSQEKIFLRALQDDPNDAALKDAYHDWLLEQGRDTSAKLIKEGFVPGKEKHQTFGYGAITSGAIASGQIGAYPYRMASGQIRGQ